MSVLLLRLSGPMQSWGTQSRFTVRDAGREPSKSGVVGLLCAALGRPRSAPVDDLAGLRMAVRVDHEGRLSRDYHTALDVIKSDGSGTTTVVSNRYYLADADFLVGLESADSALLAGLDGALRAPVWPLYLGRKSFIPGTPVAVPGSKIHQAELLRLLETYDRRAGVGHRYVVDVPFGEVAQGTAVEPRQDVPVSFAARTFGVRQVRVGFFDPLPESQPENHHVSEPPVPESA